ncbi:acetyl-CoA carboxylase biotin carboxyl carrier protein [Thermomicrobium sp. CFH 73360]|uniref:acetyl-CoA carboxylase biotin carboxyl carrier protein n=1 Tax=Thermomicrobium sp. CFH 73360 TaxID=2951987 RepID=UPI002076B770|nr:acetyl-CoA carboxylase biotin carboxyl carrier protein [Thermomicrobium sp. CFH 73360]MCM8745519.1 acetyl-CoA carboxylase biotin carboxyl carrier protein [Thermomicrobium sp. CFH 73360]
MAESPQLESASSQNYTALTRVVRELVEVMRRAGLQRLEVVQGDLRITLESAQVTSAALTTTSVVTTPVIALTPEVPPTEELETITAPMVGTFYAAPRPGADPFVRIGDHVEPGQVVAIIEAMKVMNEIVADRAGTIVEILVENGQPVEYGQPLMRLRPD